MKVTLDLGRLRADGRITPEEHDRLLALSGEQGVSVAINALVGFGVVAVSAAGLALVPSALAATALGAAGLGAGAVLGTRSRDWGVLGAIVLLVGALLFGGGLAVLTDGAPAAILIVAGVFAAVSVAARSALLAALAVVALAAALDVSTGYRHAVYALSVPHPAVTVAFFALLALGLYRLSHRLGTEGERLALTGARTALFLVNLGFWVGSLWGDTLGRGKEVHVPELAFALGWAAGLAGVGAWAVRENRRWTLNLAVVFAGIHGYTQWFARLGATPGSVLAAGLLTLGLAYALWRWNERFSGRKA